MLECSGTRRFRGKSYSDKKSGKRRNYSGTIMWKTRLSLFLILATLTILSAPILTHGLPPDTTPPSIGTPTITPHTPTSTDTVTLQVNVTDDRSVQNVTIIYTTDLWKSVNQTVLASYNATTTTATAHIPALTSGGHVAYYIIAFDNAGNKQVNNNSGNYYGYDVAAPTFASTTSNWIVLGIVLAVVLGVAFVSLRIIKNQPATQHQSY